MLDTQVAVAHATAIGTACITSSTWKSGPFGFTSLREQPTDGTFTRNGPGRGYGALISRSLSRSSDVFYSNTAPPKVAAYEPRWVSAEWRPLPFPYGGEGVESHTIQRIVDQQSIRVRGALYICRQRVCRTTQS